MAVVCGGGTAVAGGGRLNSPGNETAHSPNLNTCSNYLIGKRKWKWKWKWKQNTDTRELPRGSGRDNGWQPAALAAKAVAGLISRNSNDQRRKEGMEQGSGFEQFRVRHRVKTTTDSRQLGLPWLSPVNSCSTHLTGA